MVLTERLHSWAMGPKRWFAAVSSSDQLMDSMAAPNLGGEGQDLARNAVGERFPGGPHRRHRRGAAHHRLYGRTFLDARWAGRDGYVPLQLLNGQQRFCELRACDGEVRRSHEGTK